MTNQSNPNNKSPKIEKKEKGLSSALRANLLRRKQIQRKKKEDE